MEPIVPRVIRAAFAVIAFLSAGCGSTLVDHSASQDALALVCGPSLVACDGLCISCPSPANAHATCVSGGCGFDCDPGYHTCGGSTCTPEGPASCGPSCADCSAGVPANAGPACGSDHACTFVCSPGWLRSGASCQRAVAISAGYVHTCALLADGRVKCWGAGDSGQLGVGTTVDRGAPVDVGLPGPASTLAAGYEHTCAVVTGQPYCWGDNTFGEIGDGTTVLRTSPVPVAVLPRVARVAGGGGVLPGLSFGHTCVVTEAGALWCWGANGSGQVGDGSTTGQLLPVPVSVLPAGVVPGDVACGERHTCVRTTTGAVYCWGANDSGQLGIGSTAPQATPAVATLAAGASALALGLNHGCAIVSGVLSCWGLNSSGQVDPSSPSTGAFPSPRSPDLGAFAPTAVACGRDHTCAVDGSASSSATRCFGADNAGQLGGAGIVVTAPLIPPATASRVTAGSNHTCVLTGEGGVQCWGGNDRGQLGRGTPAPASFPPAYVSGE